MSLRNPAERLHALLKESRKQPSNFSIGDTWAKVLGLPRGDTAALLNGLAKVLMLYAETKAAVMQLNDGRPDLLTKGFPKIEAALSQLNLGSPWNVVAQHLDDVTLYSLEVRAHAFSRAGLDAEVPTEELDGLRQAVVKLVERVITAL